MIPFKSVFPARFRMAVAVGILLILIGAAFIVFRTSSQHRELPGEIERLVADREPIDDLPANPGYIGPAACAECHSDRVTEFKATRHFLANCIPESDRMPTGFQPGANDFQIPGSSVHFKMQDVQGQFLQTSYLQNSPEKSTSSLIAFIYGARGGNDEVYFTRQGQSLRELPIVWLDALKSWGASPFDQHRQGDFSREMTVRCVECHNTWFAHRAGSLNQYGSDHHIIGVTCETCHGPGHDHVEAHRQKQGLLEPRAIVRPAQLSRDRLMDLCAQCHSNSLKHRGPAFSYRPGEPLEDHYVTLPTKYPEQDHVANQTTYLKRSRCFQSSPQMTCVTCHDPHQPRSVTNAGRKACLGCHSETDCGERSRLPTAVQDDCVGCHMPERRKIQVYFQTESDEYVAPVKRWEHQIGVYQEASQEVQWRWHRSQPDGVNIEVANRLAASLAETWKARGQERQREYRYLAAIEACRESLRFVPDSSVESRLKDLIAIQREIDGQHLDAIWHESQHRYAPAISAFKRVIELKPDFAMAHARLGTTYAIIGEKQLARMHLQEAEQVDPFEPYAPAMSGWLAYLDGDDQEAIRHYRRADAVEPYSFKINYQMALALVRRGDLEEGVARLLKAISIDPANVPALLAASQALGQSGRVHESLELARRAVRKGPGAESWLNLADALSRADMWSDATEAAQQALQAAQAQTPRLLPEIRQKLAAFKQRQAAR